MASDAEGSEGLASGKMPSNSELLLGDNGKEFVQSHLQEHSPIQAISEIQSRGALQDKRCRPLLGLLDQLGVSRAEAHQEIVRRAIDALLERIPSLSQDMLLRLLEETFFCVGITELRAVPLAVLQRLHAVPATFLKQLAMDRELFWELPTEVQRQIWELDRKLLQSQALSLVTAYSHEGQVWMTGMDIDATLPENFEFYEGSKSSTGVNTRMNIETETREDEGSGSATITVMRRNRRALRKDSAALQRLLTMIGSSPVVYRGIVDICVAQYRNSYASFVGIPEAALCMLRSQLLMALHDAELSSLCASEPCYKLAWTLDACIRDREVSITHIRELRNFMKPYEISETGQALRSARVTGGRRPKAVGGQRTTSAVSGGASATGAGGSAALEHAFDNDAESAGVPGAASPAEDPSRHLGAAGMMLRDPDAFHLLLHYVLRTLERCVKSQNVPSQDKDLVFVTRLLSLAISARFMLREQSFIFPEPSTKALTVLYPSVASLMLEAELREVEDAIKPGSEEEEDLLAETVAPDDLVLLLAEDEISRRVVQIYVLERLAKGDLLSAQPALAAIARSLSHLSTVAHTEFAPFAFTLARRMTALLKAGRMRPSSAAWRMAVDAVLIRLVDSEVQVHEQVLLLLLAAAPELEPIRLSQCLGACLNNSHRRRMISGRKSSASAEIPLYNHNGDYESAFRTYMGGSGFENSGHRWQDELMEEDGGFGEAGGGYCDGAGLESDQTDKDGLRAIYRLFLKHKPDLDQQIAPELFEYLEGSGHGIDVADDGI